MRLNSFIVPLITCMHLNKKGVIWKPGWQRKQLCNVAITLCGLCCISVLTVLWILRYVSLLICRAAINSDWRASSVMRSTIWETVSQAQSRLGLAFHLGWNIIYRGADKSLARPGRKQALKHVRDVRDFNNIDKRAVIKFFFLQGNAPKEIHAILTETLDCFLPGRTKDLSAPL